MSLSNIDKGIQMKRTEFAFKQFQGVLRKNALGKDTRTRTETI